MSLSSGRNRLSAAFKDLMAQWGQTREKWDDPMSQEFETTFLAMLEAKLRNTLTAMEKLETLLAKARRECG